MSQLPESPRPTTADESRHRIRAALLDARRVAVGTHAGEEVRVRMMHPGAWLPEDETARPIVYLASMKTDPKIREMTTRPEVALLLHESPTGEEHTSWEMEVTGRAEVVRDPAERERAKQATMRTSSIVQYLDSVGQTDLLAFVRVTPRFMKHRIFGEIVAGRPPSILDFGAAADDTASDSALVKRRLGVWKETVRWPTLTASAASVVVGVAAAFAVTGSVHWGWAVLTLVGAMSLQACTNVKNDLDDQLSGADDRNLTPVIGFTGGSRVLQRGLATRADLLMLMLGFGLLSTVVGLYFALAGRPGVLLFGLGGLAIGFAYTAGLKLSNRGLGELAVGVAFGVGIVCGSAYVQAGTVPLIALAASVPVSILVALILFINGFQDAASDSLVDKRTVVVRLGLERASRAYPMLAGAAALTLGLLVLARTLPPTALLGLAGFPLFVKATRVARRSFDRPMELVPANAYTVVGHLASALALSLGLVWAGLDNELGVGLVVAALVGLFVIVSFNRSIGRVARAFDGVNEAVARS